jgi:uncharacterized OB-fold protein
MMTERLLPIEDDDRDTGGFWEAARRHELVVRTCDGCGAVLHLPRAYCHTCGSWRGSWTPVSGRGRLYSWTTVEHQVHPAYPVPYTIVLVEIEEFTAVRFDGYLPGSPELVDGQPMHVWFEELEEGVVLPQWEPVP